MSGLCLLAGGASLRIAAGVLTLAWTHSVEKVEWRETWSATPAGLELVEARVKGSGAGMEPGEGARLEDGWWVWQPRPAARPEVLLARSGATADWRLCVEGACRPLEAALGLAGSSEPVRLVPCDRSLP